MDEPWRFRSLPAGACPVCAAVHFPFCSPPRPPPPSFAGDCLRRFPPPPFAGPFPHHPPPFWDHRAPLPPAGSFPGSAIRGPEPWGGGFGWEREPLRPGFRPPPQRFFQDEFLERENSHKRMRVGDFPPWQPPYNPPMPADVERRLNLIRDHGRQQTAPTFEGEQLVNGDYARDRFVHEGLPDRDFHGHGFGPMGRNGPMFPPEPGFVHPNHPPLLADAYEGYKNFPGAPNHQGRKDFERVGMINSQFGRYANAYHEGNDLDRSKQSGDPDAGTFQLPRSDQHGDPGMNSLTHAGYAVDGKPFFDTRAQASYPLDYDPQVPPGKYHSSDQQQFHSSDHALSKQLQYSDSGSYQLAPSVIDHDPEGSHPVGRIQHPVEDKFEFRSRHAEVIRTSSEIKPPHSEDTQKPFQHHTFPLQEQLCAHNGGNQGGFVHFPGSCNDSMGRLHTSQSYPPLQPPPHSVSHVEQSPSHLQGMPSSSMPPAALFPVLSNTSAAESLRPNHRSFSESHPLPNSGYHNELPPHSSTEFPCEGLTFAHEAPSKQYLEEGGQTFPVKNSHKDEPTVINACQLFKQPYRASRPGHIAIILRGLPGSGKSYLAKALRDLEVENGGNAPRIHAMDDYFMIEVEKNIEDAEGSKSSRGKKQITKKVIEYCYEPEMEEVYRSSMLKAFKKTVDEGIFTFIIVDDRNLRVADFAQFWAIAKRSGYEVYVLEAPYKDPMGCAARNVHGFTLDDIQKMAEQWEEAPPLYLQLDIQPLFRGDDLNEQSIKEVDMDMDDADHDEEEPKLEDKEDLKFTEPKLPDLPFDDGKLPLDDGLTKDGERWDSEEEEPKEVNELGRSKWSKDFDEDIENSDGGEGNSSALSGLIQAYSKSGKSVHWGDRVDKKGFSIGAVKKRTTSSLIIGPGSGYNLVSNPLVEGEDTVEATGRSNINDSKRRFYEQLRAERESFKAVFDKRRQRIGGLNDVEDE